ncbi:MAG: hypothetical protein Q7K40_04510 [bacterium]|nr:hypothetical protein [bacterium]
MINKYIKIIIASIIIIVALATGEFLSSKSPSFKKAVNFFEKPKVVNDKIVVPETEKITVGGGRTFVLSGYNVPLVPKMKGDEIVVPDAIFTLKNAFDVAVVDAKKWSNDASLIFVKSLGTVTLQGKSSAWQFAFGSKLKKKGYEIIIQGNSITVQRETETTSTGYILPRNWYDSRDAIISIQALSQFSDAALNSLIFFYSEDGKIWQYGLSTSLGNTTMLVR